MPAREISTTIKLNGEEKFNAALRDAQRELRVMGADLKAAAAEFEFTGDKQQLLTAKSRTLRDEIAQQDKIVEALTQAVKDSAEKYGDASKQTDGYRIKLSNATATLFKLKQQLAETASEAENLEKTNIDLEFKNALDEASRSMRLYQSEAKLLGVTFRNNGQDADFLAKKSQNLKEQIAAAEKIYEETAEAMKRSAAATGEMSEETVSLKIRTNEARITLTNLRRESEDTDRSLEELGRDSNKIGRQIKDGIGDAAEDASESLDDMIKKLSSDVGDIKTSTTFTALSAGADFVTGSIGKIVDFVESSRDYRNKHALATNAIETNLNASEDEINQLILKIVGVTGESDGALEALVMLSKTGAASFTELNNMLDLILGAYVQFGEEANVEDVAESLQESVSTGTLTGKIAEVYERLGVDIEALNSAMEDLPPRERLQALMDALAGTGIAQSYRDYVNDNQGLVELNQKAAELENAKAALAEELTGISIFYYNTVISFVQATEDFIQKLKEVTNKLKESDAVRMFNATIRALEGNPESLKEQLGNTETGNFVSDFLDGFGATVGLLFGDTKRFTDLWGNVPQKIHEDFSKYVQSYADETDINKTVENMPSLFEEKGAEAGEAYIDGFNDTVENSDVDQALEFMRNRLGDENLQVEDVFQKNELQKNMTEQLGNMGADAGAELDKKLTEQLVAAANNADISGANLGTAIKNGLDSTMPLAVASAQSYAAQINAAYASLGAGLNTRIVPPRIPGQPATGGTNVMTASNSQIILEMSGRELGRAFLPTLNSMQGRNLARTSIM